MGLLGQYLLRIIDSIRAVTVPGKTIDIPPVDISIYFGDEVVKSANDEVRNQFLRHILGIQIVMPLY